jgi:hypothetical protein
VLEREAGARDDEPGVALGNGDGDAGRHDAALPWAELHAFTGDEIEARVTRVGALWQRRVVAQADDR